MVPVWGGGGMVAVLVKWWHPGGVRTLEFQGEMVVLTEVLNSTVGPLFRQEDS